MKEIKRYDLCQKQSGVFLDEEKDGFYVQYSDIEPIIEENRKMRDIINHIKPILKGLEWASDWHCPDCNSHNKFGHKSDCKLSKLIGE